MVDDTLRLFLRSRPDVWDGAALVEPLPQGSSAQLLAEVRHRKARFTQLATAYGMAAGPAVTRSLAMAEDTCAAVEEALLRGVPPDEAAATRPRSAVDPPGLAAHIIAAASAAGHRMRTRRKRAADDGGVAAVMMVVTRAMVEGGSARSVNEAMARARTDSAATAQLGAIIARALMGGYESCVRRPPLHLRTRIATASAAAVAEAVAGAVGDSPLASSALVEHIAAMEDAGTVGVAGLCGGEDRWRARVARARLVMEAFRSGAAAHWPEGAPLEAALAAPPMVDLLRRAYRKTSVGAAPPDAPPPPWLRLEEALGEALTAGDATVLAAVAAGGTLEDGVRGLAPATARACVRGDIGSLGEAERAAAGAAVRMAQCVRRLRPVPLCTAASSSHHTRLVVVCMGCFAVKNFINLRADENKAASACGFRDMMPPNRLFDAQEARCTAKATCAHAPLYRVQLTAFTSALLSDDKAIVVSPCCGLCCTAAALVPCVDGVWRCAACV